MAENKQNNQSQEASSKKEVKVSTETKTAVEQGDKIRESLQPEKGETGNKQTSQEGGQQNN